MFQRNFVSLCHLILGLAMIFSLCLKYVPLNSKEPFVHPGLLRVADQVINTETEPSVLMEWSESWWTNDEDQYNSAQWYVQLAEDMTVKDVESVIEMPLGLYFPENGYLFVGSQSSAKQIARIPGVVWVGRRPAKHKLSIDVKPMMKSSPSLVRTMLRWLHLDVNSEFEDGLPRTVFVVLVPKEQRCQLQESGCASYFSDVLIETGDIVAFWRGEWEKLGISVEAWAVSDKKAYIRGVSKNDIARANAWLSQRPEVFWLEKQSEFAPLNFESQRLLVNGPDLSSEENIREAAVLWNELLGLDGTGQIVGVADTGIDMDSCFFWESANDLSNPLRGKGPLDRNQLDLTRRKVVAYTYEVNCSLCNSCPVPITNDTIDLSVFTLQARTSNYELLAVQEKSFPADVSQASLPPRLYSTSGATLRLNVKAVTQGCPSSYCGTGAGAFDLESDVQVLIYGRSIASQANPAQPELLIDQCIQTPDFCKQEYSTSDTQCICKQKANSFNWEVQLPGSPGGFTIFIVNAGAGSNPVNIKLQGSIQFLTASKPCGDFGDDRAGHGTHVVGIAAGSASTPLSDLNQMQAASQFNGIASGAKVHFTDVMYNADPSCNIPEQICDRVGKMTLPIDLEEYLFPVPYSAGARIHLNAWGCALVEGQRGESCNYYSSQSMEVDSFVWNNQDFLVIFAAGDYGDLAQEGTVVNPATCKNCITVGATDAWNDEYRHSVRYRDPLEDICAACQFPHFCSRSCEYQTRRGVKIDKNLTSSRSATISGEFVQNSTVRDQLIGSLDPCCNDTFQLPVFSTNDQLLPKGQIWTTLFPRNMTASAMRTFVVRTLNWISAGPSLQYSITASACKSASGGCGNYPPQIQDLNTRPDPCTTAHAGQYPSQAVGITDTCLSGPQLAGCKQSPCNDTNQLLCIDPYCFQSTCTTPDSKPWTVGCPAGVQCCNDNFLMQACMNQPCSAISDTFSGTFRTPKVVSIMNALTSGFGVAIRNVGETDVLLSMNLSFHQLEYPCTLGDCCAKAKQSVLYSDRPIYPSACCSDNFTGPAGATTLCTTCPTNSKAGEGTVWDEENLPASSSRGPAMQNYVDNLGEKRYKPDLVAPGSSVVGANSDGNVNTNGPVGEYWVQCRLPASFVGSADGCVVSSAEAYDSSAAVITKSGTSEAAAFITGAAAVVRQYFADGWYPRGVSNKSNVNYGNPSAALMKALLINSARSTAGTVTTYSYVQEPASAMCADCPVWIQPPPTVADVLLQSTYQNTNPPPTPNYFEGFGRPILKNILWTAGAENSSYGMYVHENFFAKAGMMHTYTFAVANPKGTNAFGLQLKITMAYTDPPGTPGADTVLVNDLNLVVQKVVTSLVWDVNKAENVTQRSFVSTYGNSGSNIPDSSNTVEEVLLYIGNTEPELVNVTVVVVAKRLASSFIKLVPQRYALVVTGVLMTRIHYWRQIRDGILSITGYTGDGPIEDDGIRSAFAIIDFLQKGYFTSENIWMRWNLIGLPSQDQTLADNLADEADTEMNGNVNLLEFTEIVYLLRLNSMQPRDPILAEVPADPAFLGQNQSLSNIYSTSSATMKNPGRTVVFVISFLLTYLLLVQSHDRVPVS